MALRQIVSFAQLPTTAFNMPAATDFVPSTARRLRGTPLYLFNNPNYQTQYVTAIQQPVIQVVDGYLVTKRGWGNAQGNGTNVQPYNSHSAYLWLNEAIQGYKATSKFVVGFRFYAREYKNIGIAVLHNAARTTQQTLLQFSEIPNYKAGSPYYVELEFDFTNLKVNRWVDGQALASAALTASQVTNLVASGFLSFQDPQAMNVDTYSTGVTANFTDNATFALRDVYVIEDTGDASLNKRLGPQLVKTQAPLSADSADWTATPNTKSLLEALNTPYTSNDITGEQSTSVASGASLGPLTLKFTAPAAGLKVNGVSIMLAAWRPSGTVGVLQSQLVLGQSKSDPKTLNVSTAADYAMQAGVFEKAPDGAAWTPDRVANAAFTLTPTTGS